MKFGRAEAKDLLRWADTIEAGPELPRLVRKLLVETRGDLVSLGFPAGKDLLRGGWDGTVTASSGTAFIPQGESLWELSTANKPWRKAQEDYDKRTSPPAVSNPQECTYVSLTLQRWDRKDEWARERQEEGVWKEVRVYDVHDVETWLEQAPVTHAWISQQLGLEPYGIRAAESWWDGWSRATSPPFQESLVLAGRSKEVEALQARLASPPRITTVLGDSNEDIVAFTLAGCREGIFDQPVWQDRLVLVDDLRAWRMLCEHNNPLILIPVSKEILDEVHNAGTHHVIVPITAGERADICLGKLDRKGVSQALQESGLDERTADEYGRLGRRSLLSLRRKLAIKPELRQPSWAVPPVLKIVRRSLLAGRWDETNASDEEIVGIIAGSDYQSMQEELLGLVKVEDHMIERIGATWSVISGDDAWRLLGRELEDADVERLRVAALQVLKEIDPALQLPREEQMLAAVKGNVREHSGDLRQGLAASLAFMGTLGENVRLPKGATLSEVSQAIVYELLESANADQHCVLWASLQDVLPALAEAAPSVFLDAVRVGATSEPQVLQGIFTDQDSDMFSPQSAHSSVLWALEKLAWSADYFGEAVDVLARLEEIDSGGRTANRPHASLQEIFCPWWPQTSAIPEARLAAVDGLRKRHPAVAWRLMLDSLPKPQGGILMHTSEPDYREWKTREAPVTREEFGRFIEELGVRLIADAGSDNQRWIALVEKYPYVSPYLRAQIISGLAAYLKTEDPDKEAKFQLWEAMRAIISRHKAYSGAEWAMSDSDMKPFEKTADMITPEDPTKRWAWLFNEHMPEISGAHRYIDNPKRYEKELRDLQNSAIKEIYEYAGWDGLQEFGREVELSWTVGVSVADLKITDVEDEIVDLFESQEPSEIDLGMGYSVRRFSFEGWPWVDGRLERGDLSAAKAAGLLLATRDFPKAWEVADEGGSEVAERFWLSFLPYGLGSDFVHAPYAAKRLLDVGRPASALQLLGIYVRKGAESNQGELIAEILESFLTEKDLGREGIRSLSSHEIVSAFEYLQALPEFDWERLARLEWAYMRVLRYDGSASTLHRLMAESPSFFVEVISSMYYPRHQDEERSPTEQEKQVADNAFQLISSWKTVPGRGPDGTIDLDKLREWIRETQSMLSEADLLEAGEVYIGHVLGECPADPDGSMPCIEVRELFEELQNKNIEEGFYIELRNQRGATSRALGAGGDTERELAQRYKDQAKLYSNKWPRMAAIFRMLAESYEHEGRGHDDDAERFETGLD